MASCKAPRIGLPIRTASGIQKTAHPMKVAAAMKTMGLASRAEVESLRREVARLKKESAVRPKRKTAAKKKR